MKKKINKKKVITFISIILVIIAVVIAIIIFKNKEEKVSENNYEGTVGEFESQIDLTDTENSEIREDGMKINTSSKIAEEREFNGTVIKDITIESTGDMAVFNAQAVNNLEKDLEGYIIYISFLKKDGTVIDKVETFFPDIPSGETGLITATTPKDIATAYDIKIEK